MLKSNGITFKECKHWNPLRKVCILAFDGLEYDLVEKFDLKELKQVEYGKVDVSDFEQLITPHIWASFITGLDYKQLKVETRVWKNPFLEWIRKHKRFFMLNRISLKSFLKKAGFERETYADDLSETYKAIIKKFKQAKPTTIFDLAPSIAISVPPIQMWISSYTINLMKKVLENKVKLTFYKSHVLKVFSEKRKLCFEKIKGKWTIFMVHFLFTDLLGHFYINRLEKMRQIYDKAKKVVAEIKKELSDDTLLIILSDHGMKPMGEINFGEHSKHGFYSLNYALNLKEPHIKDFFTLIKKIATK
jgi:hypothetical protein